MIRRGVVDVNGYAFPVEFVHAELYVAALAWEPIDGHLVASAVSSTERGCRALLRRKLRKLAP